MARKQLTEGDYEAIDKAQIAQVEEKFGKEAADNMNVGCFSDGDATTSKVYTDTGPVFVETHIDEATGEMVHRWEDRR